MSAMTPAVVVHIPHASLAVPTDVAGSFLVTTEQLDHELLVMTDRYTDELFALPASIATTVTFPVSRLVVDPERFADDALEPMARKGMGVVYERTASGQGLRHPPSRDERERLLARFYEPHHAALAAAVQASLDLQGTCLVVDGHSFPAQALPFEHDQRADRPDICVGTDPWHTPDGLRDVAVRTFEELGWSVAVDRPFAGALVPMRFYRRGSSRPRHHGRGQPRALHERDHGVAIGELRRGQRGRVGCAPDDCGCRRGRRVTWAGASSSGEAGARTASRSPGGRMSA